jgi:peptidoglycan/LPS O-acetylase OafA/YrhL
VSTSNPTNLTTELSKRILNSQNTFDPAAKSAKNLIQTNTIQPSQSFEFTKEHVLPSSISIDSRQDYATNLQSAQIQLPVEPNSNPQIASESFETSKTEPELFQQPTNSHIQLPIKAKVYDLPPLPESTKIVNQIDLTQQPESSQVKTRFNPFGFLFQSREFDFHSNAFDFLRLFLALVVVVYHGFIVFNTNNGHTFFRANWIYFPFDMLSKEEGYTHIGSIAVLGFFIISGFLIARSAVYTKSWLEFFQKRFWRVYPGYIMSLLVACVFLAPLALVLQDKFDQAPAIAAETWQFFIRNILIETPVIQIPTLTSGYFSGSYWTLLQEVRAYILIAFLGYLGLLKQKKWTVALTILTNAVSVLVLYNDSFRKMWDILFYDFRFIVLFNYFLVGACFFLYLDRIRWSWISFGLSLVLLYLGVEYNLMGLVGPIAGSYGVLFLSQVLPFKNWSKKIGDWSYGVYVYSSPIQICLLFTPFGRSNFGIYLLISILLSLFFGYLSWNYWEKRFLVKKLSQTNPKTNVVQTPQMLTSEPTENVQQLQTPNQTESVSR